MTWRRFSLVGVTTLYAEDLLLCQVDMTHLQQVLNWYSTNLVYLNPSKTNFVRFHSHKKKVKTLNVIIANIAASVVDSGKFLGVHIDHHLNWKDHCDGVNSKLSSCSFYESMQYINSRSAGDAILYACSVESSILQCSHQNIFCGRERPAWLIK